jgi:hypothetical protein
MNRNVIAAAQVREENNGRLLVVDSLQIGKLTARNLSITATWSGGVRGTDGLIGLGFYRQLLLTVDFNKSLVSFSRDTLPAGNGALKLEPRGTLFGVTAKIGSNSLPMTIDTQGGGIGVMCGMTAFASLPTVSSPAKLGEARIGGANVPPTATLGARLNGKLELGSIALERPIVSSLQIPNQLGCLLGLDFLRTVSMSFDQRTMRVRFDGNPAIAPPPPVYISGISVLPDSAGAIRIASVREGTAAEIAGLRTGDEVIEIAGKPANPQTASSYALRLLSDAGQQIDMKVRRGSQIIPVEVKPLLVIQ